MTEYELLTVTTEGGNPVIRRRAADALFPERAAANAVLRTVTGDPAGFSDGAADRAVPVVEAKIEPVQDLHGYDFPWAKGARNLVDPDAVTQDGADTVWIFRNDPYPFWNFCRYILSLQGGIAFDELAILGEDGETVLASVAGGETVDYLRWKPGDSDTNVIRGMIRIRGTGILAADVKAHAQLEVGASDTAVPTDWVPYENACPISGRSGAKVTRRGKNLFDQTQMKNNETWNYIPIRAAAGTVLTMSTNQPYPVSSGLLTYFRKPGGPQTSTANVYAGHPVTKTVGAEGYLEIAQRNRDGISVFADWNYQIEVGSAATDYEPYQGEICDVAFPSEAGTVYGGTLDLTDGRLTVTDAAVTRTLAGHAVDRPFISMISATYQPDNRYQIFLLGVTNREELHATHIGLVAAPGTLYDPERDGELIPHPDGGDPEGYYTRYVEVETQYQSPRQKTKYRWTKSNVNPGDVWYARPWVRYTDGVNTYDVYGEQVKTVAGEDRIFFAEHNFGYDDNTVTVSVDYCRNYRIDDLPVSFKAGGAQRSSLIRYARALETNNFFMEGTSLYASVPERTADTVENQPILFCGELEEPLTFRLTPRQVKALAGENRFSADCGPVTVTYVADTETVIDGGLAADRAMLASEASGGTASRGYAVGEFLTVGETLYKVTAAIASGETVTPGENVTATTVGEQLTALFNLINS